MITGNLTDVQFVALPPPRGKLAIHEEFPEAVADAAMGFLRENQAQSTPKPHERPDLSE